MSILRAEINTPQEAAFYRELMDGYMPLVIFDEKEVASVRFPVSKRIPMPLLQVATLLNAGWPSKAYDASGQDAIAAGIATIDAYAPTTSGLLNYAVGSVIEVTLSWNINVSRGDILGAFTYTVPGAPALVLSQGPPVVQDQPAYDVTTNEFRVQFAENTQRPDQETRQGRTKMYFVPYTLHQDEPSPTPVVATESGSPTPKPVSLDITQGPDDMTVGVRLLPATDDFVRSIMRGIDALFLGG